MGVTKEAIAVEVAKFQEEEGSSFTPLN